MAVTKDLLDEAIHFATDAFSGKKRKCSGCPAVLHSLEAAAIVAGMTDDEQVIAATVLHDVIEDAGITSDEIREKFGDRVTKLVLSETEDKRSDMPPAQTWKLRKQEAIALLDKTDDRGVKLLFLGDKLSNMRSVYNDISLYGDNVWNNFNQKDPREHYWYYNTIAESLSEFEKYPAWQEYKRLISLVFEKEERE